jgi:large subunit ribosomal protein L21
MDYAIVENGGKQYRAVPGATIDVDHMAVEVGDQVEFDRVLLLADGEQISVGTPTIDGARVQAKAVAQIKAPKIVVFKYKPSKRYRVKSGHRQRYTRLLIEEIQAEK